MDLNPLSQLEVEHKLMSLVEDLLKVTSDVAFESAEAARADWKYRVAYAKAFLVARTDGQSEKTSDATAVSQCEDLLFERREREARLTAAQESGRNIRSSLEALRSINANLRPAVAEGG